MSHIIHARDNERADLGEFTPEKVTSLILHRQDEQLRTKHWGYSIVALDNPKCLANLGGALRAAHCYGASLVLIGGARMQRISSLVTDTAKVYKHIPVLRVDDVMKHIPYSCVPVAVDLVDGARDLCGYIHPERAVYIFGPDDGTLGKRVTENCRDKIMIPTRNCMNLAATVNVVLYDRLAKTNR